MCLWASDLSLYDSVSHVSLREIICSQEVNQEVIHFRGYSGLLILLRTLVAHLHRANCINLHQTRVDRTDTSKVQRSADT